MSALCCPCGETLHDTDYGRWHQFASFVLTPVELEEFEASVRLEDDEPTLRELWRCVCGRIAIDKTAEGRETEGREVQWYVPISPVDGSSKQS
jgi:hypothetical protein